MHLSRLFPVLIALFAVAVHAAPPQRPATLWHGYPRTDFVFENFPATVIAPAHESAAGKPWIWKARFLDHRPDLDLALLELGFHVAFLEDTTESLGAPDCVARYDRFHAHVTKTFGLSQKAALEGLSRGGLYVYNFAAAHPDKVACIYADGAVLDFRSWPAGKSVFPEFSGPGSKGSWESLKKHYGFADDAAAQNFTGFPVDHLKRLVDAKIGILHVIGEADPVVPHAENTFKVQKRLEELGAPMTLITKPGEKHAHGAPDLGPVVEFVVKHTCGSAGARPVLSTDKGPARRILFLGDSISQAGKWVEYVAGVLRTRYPDREFDLINIGLSSETTSGLSEDGHAGGKFPRPDLHERLSRALDRIKPEIVIACYGMNDGIYKPLADDRFGAFKTGMTKLRDAVNASGARLVLLTPPMFDPLPIEKRTSADGAGGPYKGYDDVLAAYGAWQMEQRANGWGVGDLHSLMASELAERRKIEPNYTFSRDGIHPNAAGHWIMATALLRQIGVPPEGDLAALEAGEPRAGRGNVREILISPAGELSFTWKVRKPIPRDPELEKDALLSASALAPAKFDARRLSVSGLKSAKYTIYANDVQLGQFTKEELARGLDVTAIKEFPGNGEPDRLRKLIHEQVSSLADSWRQHVGHKRPGVNPGQPLDKALEAAAAREKEIRQLTAPVDVKIRVTPVGQ